MTLGRVLVGAYVLVLGVMLALAFSEPFGTGNQNTYLLDPLVRAYPELYRNDWFVTANNHYHVVFAIVTAPLFQIDADGTRAFAIAQLVVAVSMFAAIYGLVAAITTRARLVAWTGVVAVLLVGGDRALGGSYLFTGYLQPSSLATLAWLCAINAWIRERLVLAGIVLAIGGAFHLNYAVLGIGIFALCELAAGPRFCIRRMALLLVPSLVVVAAFLPTMLASSKTDEDALALRVLIRFCFPVHFSPLALVRDLPALLGWLLVAIALRPEDRSGPRARLFWIAAVTMTVTVIAVGLVCIPPLLPLTRLFVWRIAPFGVLAAQLLLLVEVREIATGLRPRPRGWSLLAVIVGAAAIAFNAFVRRRAPSYAEVITCVLVASAVALTVRREQFVTAVCACLCTFALWTQRAALRSPPAFESTDTGATAWARTWTPRDALFLVPPHYNRFRLNARRAIVVDLKSPPMYLDELVAWYRRICRVIDVDKADSLPAVRARWAAMTPDEIVAAAARFDASYIVIDKRHGAQRLALPVVFEDDTSAIFVAPSD